MKSDRTAPEATSFVIRLDEVVLLIALIPILAFLADSLHVAYVLRHGSPRLLDPDEKTMDLISRGGLDINVSWSLLIPFRGWLLAWAAMNLFRASKARVAGDAQDRGPWIFALLMATFTVNGVNLVWLKVEWNATGVQTFIGVILFLVAGAAALLALEEVMTGLRGRSRRQIIFATTSLLLAVAVLGSNMLSVYTTYF